MNKTVFVIVLIVTAGMLTGWIFALSSRLREPETVEAIDSKWWRSQHANVDSESFVHWNEDDPPEVPVACAKCHSGRGFLDYVGHDGSAPMVVDKPAQTGAVVSCMVCHNEAANRLETVHFPSGTRYMIGRKDATCATCHSGTRSGQSVMSASEGFADDEVVEQTGFIGPHYAFAAATLLGHETAGGYEYPGMQYAGRFEHAEGVRTCTQCHDPHSLSIRSEFNRNKNLCAACHSEVTDRTDYRSVVKQRVDYDGDGSVAGVYYEIRGLMAILHDAIHKYTSGELGSPAGWADRFPYFFVDQDGDGTISPDEASFPNRYQTFTPRLLRAAFNYQFAAKDPGGYVHNAAYVLQLLYDSIEDLSVVVETPAGLRRAR